MSLAASDDSAAFDFDVVVIGGGAAGIAAAIFTRRRNPSLRVAVFEGARVPGAKILVSGGSRCNVTNRAVSEADFCGGSRTLVRRVLRAWSAADTVEWFQSMAVPLHEEPGGKMFPDSDRSRDVVTALLRELAESGAELHAGRRVLAIAPRGEGFTVDTPDGRVSARSVVLSTGGLSLPKTGSDGWGYTAARSLGHTIVPTTPALVPLVMAATSHGGMHAAISGVTLNVRLRVASPGVSDLTADGAMLWTHFGVSGPAALDISRHLLRARLEERAATLTVSFCPADRFEVLDARWIAWQSERPRATVAQTLARLLPSSMAAAVGEALRLADVTMAELTRENRRRVVHALLGWPLDAQESRGYSYAEVTAGGVPLDEVNVATMQSRRHRGLYFAGEILDVDGRIGGFNFQWAWATASVVGSALARQSS